MRQMKWRKLGSVFCPSGEVEWMRSHAANPIAEHLEGNLFRVYFSPRDSQNRGRIAWLDMELNESTWHVHKISGQPLLSCGEHGMFDDSGVTVAGLIRNQGRRFLYYLGWNLGVTIPFRNAIGLAIAEPDSCIFTRISSAPILDRNHVDPISLSYPYVLFDRGRFRIWYGSCDKWDGPTVADYQFSLRYAESHDGVTWELSGKTVLACDYPNEDAIARPCVVRDGDKLKMWYSRKSGPNYRLGYAESEDGMKWTRLDRLVGIDVSESGWDSDMVEYPFVFDHAGHCYMLYNGNGYGKTGFGLAILETE